MISDYLNNNLFNLWIEVVQLRPDYHKVSTASYLAYWIYPCSSTTKVTTHFTISTYSNDLESLHTVYEKCSLWYVKYINKIIQSHIHSFYPQTIFVNAILHNYQNLRYLCISNGSAFLFILGLEGNQKARIKLAIVWKSKYLINKHVNIEGPFIFR